VYSRDPSGHRSGYVINVNLRRTLGDVGWSVPVGVRLIELMVSTQNNSPGLISERIYMQTFLLGFIAIIYAAEAHAYLDMGTGAMLLQGFIAALLAVGVFFKDLKEHLARRLGFAKHDESSDQEDHDASLDKTEKE
jgi:hypothetical protein